MTRQPENRTRVNLSLPDELISLLDRIGAVTGAGRASIVREWLIGALPALSDVADALEVATVSQSKAFKLLESALSEAEAAGQAALDLGRTSRAMRMKGRK